MASQEYKALLDEAWDLHVRKNAGYAGAENPDPWANFRMCEAFGIPAFEGCMVRLSDKYIRITNLMCDSSNDRVGESIRDTLQDLAAYAFIAICLLDEKTKAKADDRPMPSWNVLPEYPTDFGPLPEGCEHPLDTLYTSVAGTKNCGVCFNVLMEADARSKCSDCYRPAGDPHLAWCRYHENYVPGSNPWHDA
jgi:hypothetical protein